MDLNNEYDLTFSTINFDLKNIFLNQHFFNVNGKDDFELELNIQKNSSPFLRIYSDLKNIEFISPLSSLTKSKTKILPTEILITNLLNPSLKS